MTEQETEIRLRTLALAACKRHDEIEAALTYMLDKLKRDATLQAALLAEAMRSASLRAIYQVRHDQKGDLKATACGRASDTVSAYGDCLTSFIDWFLLPDGRMLGDATGEELPELAATERAIADGHEKNAMFYSALAKRVKAKQTIRAVMESKQVAKLWEQIAEAQSRKASAA